jgi:hypothetical protein
MNSTFQGNLSALLHNQGLTTIAFQQQFLSQLTGEPLYVIAGWGIGLEFIPPLYHGLVVGYIAGINAAQAAIAHSQNQASTDMTSMAWQNYSHNQAIAQAQVGQLLAMRY